MAQAHLQKKEFIGKLLDMGKHGPLALLTMNMDGEPYYRIKKASFLIGMVGLNELVQYHTGQQLHESKEAIKFGLKVIAYMKKESEEHRREVRHQDAAGADPGGDHRLPVRQARHEVLPAAGGHRRSGATSRPERSTTPTPPT